MHQGKRKNPAAELDPLAYGCPGVGSLGTTRNDWNSAAAAVSQTRDCAQAPGTLGSSAGNKGPFAPGGYCPKTDTDLQVGGDMFAGLFCDTIRTSTYRSGNGQAIDWMGEGWYRFTGAAGTRMYDVALDGPGVYSTPGRTACGPDDCPCSGKPMTLERGGHPSIEDGEVRGSLGLSMGSQCNRKSRSSTARQATTCTTSQAQHSATRATAALARPSRTRTVLSRPSEAASFARYASRGTSRQGWRDSIRPDRDGRNGTPPPHIRFKERSEGVVLASRRPPLGVCLFLSLFSVPRQFSQRPGVVRERRCTLFQAPVPRA